MFNRILIATAALTVAAFTGCSSAPPVEEKKPAGDAAAKETPQAVPLNAADKIEVRATVEVHKIEAPAHNVPAEKTSPAPAERDGAVPSIAGYTDHIQAYKAASDFHAEGGEAASKMMDALENGKKDEAKKHYYEAKKKYESALKIYVALSEYYTPEAGYTQLEENIRGLGQEMEDLQKAARSGW